MVFVADDLGAWLVGLLADAGRKKLTSLVLGTDQQRALRQAAVAAVERTAEQLAPSGGEQAEQLAMVVGEVFREPTPDAAVARQATLLEALQAGIADKLAVLDDPDITGTGQSSAELLGVPGGVLAETLAGHLVREIMVRGSRGGPLAPLADQLNHDVTHLQGQRLEGMLAQLAGQVMALARAGGGAEAPRKPVRLPPRPVFLAGREELLAEVGTRLTAGDDPGPRLVALCGLGGAGKTSVAVEYAHRHLAEVGVAWQFAAEDADGAGGRVRRAGRPARRPGPGRCPGPGGVGARGAGRVRGAVAADLRQRGGPGLGGGVPAPAGPGRVLITSQNPDWPGQALDVPMLDPDVAADFLVNRTGDPDRQAARDLADELGGLPLALEQAAAYIQATGDNLAGYLALFRQRRAGPAGPRGAHRVRQHGRDHLGAGVRAAGAGRARRGRAAAAAGVLRPRGDPAAPAAAAPPRTGRSRSAQRSRRVLVPLLEDPLAADDAVAALRRYSLISPPHDGPVSVHRLVQAVTLAQLPAEQAAAVAAGRRGPDRGRAPRRHASSRKPGRSARRCCRTPRPHSPDSDGMAQIASYLGRSGNYTAARDLSRQMLEAREQDARPRAPRHPGRPRQPRLLDRDGGGCGRGPGPVRRAAARTERVSAPSTRTPWPPAATSPAGPGRRGMRPGPGTSSPRCCRYGSGCLALSTSKP